MTAAKRLALLLGTLAAVLLGTAVPASAHAALVKSDPGQGSVVKSTPTQVQLTFSEGVLLSDDSLRVLDPAGKDVEQGTAHHIGGTQNTAAVNLRSGLGNGTYTVAWKAVSADTHPVAGAWTFSVGAPSKTSAAVSAQPPGGGAVGTLYGIGRYFSYGGFALLVGACAFLAVCWPPGARLRVMQKTAVGGWVTLTASTIALLLLRGPYVNGTGLGGVFDLGQLQAAVETKEGTALVSRLLLLAAAVVFLSVLFGAYTRRYERRGERNDEDTGDADNAGDTGDGEDAEERRDIALGLGLGGAVIAVGIAATWAMTEHASVGIQPGVAMPVDVLHLLAMAVWLGGLVTLVVALYRTSGVERTAVRRFSRIAFGCVCVLVSTGIYQAWRQVGSWHALFTTSYGQLLIVKIGLVALMVGTASMSRRWTARLADVPDGAPEERNPVPAEVAADRTASETPERAAQLARQRAALAAGRAKRRRDADPAHVGLRRSVLTEAAIAAVVLAVTTVLSGSEPGRATEESAAAGTGGDTSATGGGSTSGGPALLAVPYDTGGPNGKGTASIHLDPARTGGNVMHLGISDPSGKPVDVPEVDVSLTLPSRGLGPIPVSLRHDGTGEWAATSLQLPMPGQWQLKITVRTDDIDETTVARNVTVG